METRWFLTVDWCKQGKRGIFCDKRGNPYSSPTQHTRAQIVEILDVFGMVLNPISLPLNEAQVAQVTTWYPLAEYSNEFGYAVIPDAILEVANDQA